jgi:hypothetical protein
LHHAAGVAALVACERNVGSARIIRRETGISQPLTTMSNRCFPTLLLSLAACVPIVQTDMPNGDHTVTTYVRLQGFEEARNDNLWVARQTCKGGVVLIEERDGVDEYGHWDRLVYGCLADERAAAASQNEKKPPP